MTDTITAADLADLLGVNTRSIRDLAKRDIIVRAGADYVLGESVRRYCAHLRKLATGRRGEAAITSATAERGRLARAQAEHIEMKNARHEIARCERHKKLGEACAVHFVGLA